MCEIIGVIDKILYRDNKTGEVLVGIKPTSFAYEVNEYGNLVVKGIIREYKTGFPVKVFFDEMKEDVFLAKKIVPHPDNDLLKKFLAGKISGIGKATTDKILSGFANIFDTLENEPDEFVQTLKRMKLKDDQIKALRSLLEGKRGVMTLFEVLKEYDIDYEKCNEIFEGLGMTAEALILKNPYRLQKFHIPFLTIERIASDNSFYPYCEARYAGLAQEMYRLSTSGGDSYMELTIGSVRDFLNYIKKNSPYEEIPTVLEVLSEFTSKDYKVIKHNEKVLVYSLASYHNEVEVKKQVFRIISERKKLKPVTNEDIENIENNLGIIYSGEQKSAFSLLNSTGIKLITGGAGSGKSTVLKGVVRAFKDKYPDKIIRGVCPTRRASARLREVCGEEFVTEIDMDEESRTIESIETIHKTLGLTPLDNGMNFLEFPEVNTDLLLVDETSMVDLWLMGILLRACKKGMIIIFVGDVNQLSSVGEGSVFRDFIDSGLFETVRLFENHRQTKEGRSIVQNAERVLYNTGNFTLDEHFSIVSFEKEKLHDILTSLSMDNAILLSPMKKNTFGTRNCNKILQESYIEGKNLPSITIGDTKFYLGDKIIFMKNHYSEEIAYYNGDMGTIKGFRNGEILIESEKKTLSLPRECFSDICLAYAITIHKSQGSEKDEVYILLSPEHLCMLNKNLLYTAITRGKNKVTLLVELREDRDLRKDLLSLKDGAKRKGLLKERLLGEVA